MTDDYESDFDSDSDGDNVAYDFDFEILHTSVPTSCGEDPPVSSHWLTQPQTLSLSLSWRLLPSVIRDQTALSFCCFLASTSGKPPVARVASTLSAAAGDIKR